MASGIHADGASIAVLGFVCTVLLMGVPQLATGDETLQASADALYAAENWKEAAAAYEALLRGEPSHGQNWFNLAQARHRLSDYAGARDGYLKAIQHNYQPLARTRFHLARAYASLGQAEQALGMLEEIAKTGGPSGQSIQSTAEFQPYLDNPRFVAVIAALTPCNTQDHRAFDFWLGKWDVTPAGASQPTATNEISSREDGCVVFEQYQAGGFTGMSINFYDAGRAKWHQTWMSNQGGALYLEGGLNAGGEMVMSDADLPSSAASGTINRITWTPRKDGTVRQRWQSSSDGGATWTDVFDGIYELAAETR